MSTDPCSNTGSESERRQPGMELTFPRPGAIRLPDGSVEWNLWAPREECVDLILDPAGANAIAPMSRSDQWFHYRMENVPDGTLYQFRLAAGDFPDPATRWQPSGVHGASAVFTPEAYHWRDTCWRGIDRSNLVIYEVHVGTFTQPGTFRAMIDRLGELLELGISAIELMPVGQFPGERNWGYDGVQPYAVQNSYGGPQELQQFIDSAHQAGLAVILDVVYNHLGPEGNYLGCFGPYFTKSYQTPWGEALNFDGPDSDPVRQFMIENARMWIRDFRFDGLRLDAVHAIYDLGARPVLAEIQEAVHQVGMEQERTVHVIAESDRNDPRLIDPVSRHGIGIDAVWADEFHHCIRSLIAGDHQGYYADFGEIHQLAKAFESVFVFDGQYSRQRKRRHGAPIGGRDRTQFVVCVHNHDQVGNRAAGDRSATYLSESVQRLACGLLMLSPCTPMLFMGEEYGEQNPFPFFCSFGDQDLIKAVNEGRRREFTDLGFEWDDIPEPQSETTFQSAKLSWSWAEGTFASSLRRLYRDLLRGRQDWAELRDRVRTAAFVPELSEESDGSPPLLVIERGEGLIAVANLSENPHSLPMLNLINHHLQMSTEELRYGGERSLRVPVIEILPHELLIYRGNHD